ncbi:MAG: iron-containing alcohol dehydrogenase family protein [Promethearchaeota archaeon]
MNLIERDSKLKSLTNAIFNRWPRTKVIFGNGTLKDIGKIGSIYGKKALIVIGGGSVQKAGYLDTTIISLDENNIQVEIFYGVEPNPSIETVDAIAKMYNEGNFDFTIALGGGSVMDAAKTALILTSLHEIDIRSYFGVNKIIPKIDRISPLICIPTTSGTGSEVTKYSVITDTSIGLKFLIADIAIHPHYAIIDPNLTISCPADLTRTVGLDAMTHSLEGYLNIKQDLGNEETNKRALIALEIIFKWLRIALDDPADKEARKMMSIASVLGGMVIGGTNGKGTGGPHMNSYSWAKTIDHGKSCGIMMPYYLVYYAKNPKIQKKLNPIAKLLKIPKNIKAEEIGLIVAQKMLDWYKDIGFYTKLVDIPGWKSFYKQKALEDAGKNAMKLQAMPNPVALDQVNEIIGPIIQAAIDGDLTTLQNL